MENFMVLIRMQNVNLVWSKMIINYLYMICSFSHVHQMLTMEHTVNNILTSSLSSLLWTDFKDLRGGEAVFQVLEQVLKRNKVCLNI